MDFELIQALATRAPFAPFSIVTNSGERVLVRTADHIDLPPVLETGERPGYLIVYTDRSMPRFVSIDNVSLVETKEG